MVFKDIFSQCPDCKTIGIHNRKPGMVLDCIPAIVYYSYKCDYCNYTWEKSEKESW